MAAKNGPPDASDLTGELSIDDVVEVRDSIQAPTLGTTTFDTPDPVTEILDVDNIHVLSIPAPRASIPVEPHDTLPPSRKTLEPLAPIPVMTVGSSPPAGVDPEKPKSVPPPLPSKAPAATRGTLRPPAVSMPSPTPAEAEPSSPPPRARPTSHPPASPPLPAVDPADARTIQRRQLLETCLGAIEGAKDPGRRARLHLSAAQIYEHDLADRGAALEHYEKALGAQPDLLPALRAARRIAVTKADWPRAVELLGAEARATRNGRARAALHLLRGRILRDHRREHTGAREAFQAALELDRTNIQALSALETLAETTGDAVDLDRWLEAHIHAVTGDPALKAALLVRRARLHAGALGDADGAIELYETALATEPDLPVAIAALKRLLHEKRRYSDLVRILQHEAGRTEGRSDRAQIHARIARISAERLGDRDRAIDHLEQALTLDPGHDVLMEQLAELYDWADRPADLARLLTTLVSRSEDPRRRFDLLVRLGALAEERLGDLSGAVDWFLRARELQPTFTPVHHALTRLLEREGRWDELLPALRAEAEVLDDAHQRAGLFARMADVLEKHLQRHDEAIEHHLRAVALVPTYAPSLASLERLYAETGRWRELVELLRQSVEQTADNTIKVAQLARIASIEEESLADPQQALQTHRDILKIDPRNFGAVRGVARAAERAGAHADVVEALEKEASLVQASPLRASLLERAGSIARARLGDHERAIALYRRALEVCPDHAGARASLAESYLKLGRWEALLETYAATLPHVRFPHDRAQLLTTMGELCEFRIGREADAAQYYRQATEADPRHVAALRALTRGLRHRGEWDELAVALQQWLERLAPGRERALVALELGEVLEERLGRAQEAVAALIDASNSAPDLQEAGEARTRLHATLGDHDALLTDLEQGGHGRPLGRALADHWWRAEVFSAAKKDRAQAIAELETALLQCPADPLLLMELESLYRASERWDALALAESSIARTVHHVGERVTALWRLAELEEGGRVDGAARAEETYQSILSLAAQDPGALDALERIAIASGNRRLLADVDARLAAIGDDPASVALHLARLGETLVELRDPGAVDALRAALDADPENLIAVRALSDLATRVGDPTLLADAARREATLTRDGRVAASLLVESARVRLENLLDDVNALADLERALDLDPDNVDAARWLTQQLEQRQQYSQASDVLSKAALAAKSPERRAALWLDVARLQSEAIGNVPAAISALNRVLRAAPNHTEALRQLASLYVRDGQWMEAVTLLGRVVQFSKVPEELREAHLELARIWLEKLGDATQARASIDVVLSQFPDNPEALAELSSILEADGDLNGAIDASLRALEHAPSDPARSDTLLRIARLEHRRGNASRAQEFMLDAVAYDGPSSEAALELKATMSGRNAWLAYAAALDKHASYCLARGHSPIPTLLELSRVHHGELRDPAQAAAVLERGIPLTTSPEPLRSELAVRLREAGRLDDALRELRLLVAHDPTAVMPYREMARIFQAKGDMVSARWAIEPLAIVGEATRTELAFITEAPRRTLFAGAGTLAHDVVRRAAPELDDQPVLRAMLKEIEPHLGKIYPPDYDAFGLTARDKEGTRQPSALRELTTRIADIAGVKEIDLFVHRVRSRGVALELGEPHGLFVPATLEDLALPQQVFLLAKPVLAVGLGVSVVEKLTPRELEVLVAAAVRLSQPTFGDGLTSEEVLEETKRRLHKALSRKARKTVEELGHRLMHAPPIDFATWCARTEQALRSLAALLSDDLLACVDVTRRLERDAQARDGADLVRRSATVHALIQFWVAGETFTLRNTIGMLDATTRGPEP